MTATLGLAYASGPSQQIILKYRDKLEASQTAEAARAVAQVGGRYGVTLLELRKTATGAHVMALDRELSRADLESLIGDLAAIPGVEYAEEDVLLQPLPTPNKHT